MEMRGLVWFSLPFMGGVPVQKDRGSMVAWIARQIQQSVQIFYCWRNRIWGEQDPPSRALRRASKNSGLRAKGTAKSHPLIQIKLISTLVYKYQNLLYRILELPPALFIINPLPFSMADVHHQPSPGPQHSAGPRGLCQQITKVSEP